MIEPFSTKKSFIFLFASAIVIIAGIQLLQHRTAESSELVAAKAGEKLHQQEEKIFKRLDQLTFLSSDSAVKESIFNQCDDKSISYFAYLKDSLFAWSDNGTLLLQEEADSFPSGFILKLRNGWYEIFRTTKDNYHFYSTLLIKNEFAYQNKFLVNNFNPELKIPDTYGLYTFQAMDAVPVKIPAASGTERTLFYLAPDEPTLNTGQFSPEAWLYMLAAFLLIGAIYSLGRWLLKKSLALAIFFSLLVVAMRLLIIQFHIPDQLYATELFSPRLYASQTYMNSLGDFLFNVLLLLSLLLIFLNPFKQPIYSSFKFKKRSLVGSLLLYISYLFVVIFAGYLLIYLMSGIVFNSSINFNTTNIFDLNRYSFTGLLIIAILMLIFFILIKGLVNFQRTLGDNPLIVIGACVLIAIIPLVAYSTIDIGVILLVLLYLSVYIFSSAGEGTKEKGFSLSAIVTFLFISALVASVSIYGFSKIKEKENRKLLAGKVEAEQDRVAEHLFEDLQDKIADDTTLQNYFKKPSTTSFLVSQRLHRRYFNGYWTKYEVGSYCFDTLNHPFNKTLDSTSYDEFQEIISTVGKPTYADNLFFLTNSKGKSMYLARIPVRNMDGAKAGTIFIELEPKFIQATQGFPELFVSDKVAFNKDLANYSYAKYKNDELVNQYGDFAYYFSALPFGKEQNECAFINKDGYNHLLYRESPNDLIVVSKKQDTIYALITSFSYFFAFFSILLVIIFAFRNLIQGKLFVSLSLKTRIQVSIIAIVVFSVALIGAGTIYYIIEKYDVNQSVDISGKLQSLIVTIENDLDEQLKPDTALNEDIIFKLSRLSSNSSVDFNWYDEDGNLLFSSQPKIFDQGITSTLMNPAAFDKLSDKQETQFVHPENIGRLNYIAAYQTLRNRQNQLLGYISLPFFEKENELNREISTFLSALINIYVLLLSLTVLVTFFIASRITKPLLLIQEKLANINLGKRNEFIQWNEQDEIGALVKEYNKKVEELALSADMLARSERESAWQEMAKQVAHEIKNPLTPMKLGVQHLLSAFNNNSPDKEELLKKISQTLIQQIDTLSNIANEFSNFAKMPQTRNEIVDISSILADTINLFKESPNVRIAFQNNDVDLSNAKVLADKDQLIRLFSNLLKNAVQSIPSGRRGAIEVSLTLNQGVFTVSVRDNGSGIADNQVEKIFTPNFTTKSGGMGLGLAIVKNIVENSGGKVWFETQIDLGTTFFVTLPVLSQ